MPWPKNRVKADALRLERHAAQSWRPACARCGRKAPRQLVSARAEAWWREHVCPNIETKESA